MKILSIKTCNTDLYDLGMRKLLREFPDARFTVVGGHAIVKCVPRHDRFTPFELNQDGRLLSKLLELYRLAHSEKIDMVFYGYDDQTGYPQFIFDLFALILPWKKLIIGHRLQLREYRSRTLFLFKLFLKSITAFGLFLFGIRRDPPIYRLSFSDELLHADQPKHFTFSEKAPAIQRKTFDDETRNCFSLHAGESVSLRPDEPHFDQVAVGFGAEVKNMEKDDLIKLGLVRAGKTTSLLEQPASTLLPEWNDHTFDSGAEFRLEFQSKNPSNQVFVSYPNFIKKSKTQNIIVIILDGLNLNHLGLYNPKSTCSPNIDRFFDKKIKYTSAFTQEIWTRPTFASMFTSYYPSHHGIYDKTFFLEVPKTLPNLAEAMRENGYLTSAYVSHGWAGQLYGYSRGFDRFIWREAFEKFRHDAKLINYFALETLENHKDRNQFIFLHYFDTHLPFFPHSPYRYYNNSLNDYRDVKKIYAAAKAKRHFSEADQLLIERDAINKVREIDILLEPLFLKLQTKELRENTSVILTADHGFGCLKSNAFLDNGTYRLTPETAQVPLLVSPAENLALRFKNSYAGLVEGSVDLYPSVLDLAKVSAETSPYSQSYIPDRDGEMTGKSFALMESLYFDTYQIVIRNQKQHYYLRCAKEFAGGKVLFDQAKEEKLFDLTSDPDLTRDLSPTHGKLLEPFHKLRKDLGVADYRSVPKSVARQSKSQTVAI